MSDNTDMIHIASALWKAAMAAHSTPFGAALFNRMSKPQVGDLVMERSTIYMTEMDEIRVGRFVGVEDEPRKHADGEDYRERVWTIEVDGAHVRWINCDFLALPDLRDVERWLADKDPRP